MSSVNSSDDQGEELYSHHGVLWKNLGIRDDDGHCPGTLSIIETKHGKCIEWKTSDVSVDSDSNDPEWTVVNTGLQRSNSQGTRSRLFHLPLADLHSFRISKHGHQLILIQNEQSVQNTFFFQNGNADSFVGILRGILKTAILRKDRHFYRVLNTQDSKAVDQSFAELDLFSENKSDYVWKFVKDFHDRPYEATMTAFSKLTDALLFGRSTEEKKVEEEVAELLTQSWTPDEPGSNIGSDEYEVIGEIPPLPNCVPVNRGPPLTVEQWVKFQDDEGRVNDVDAVKSIIFRGGVVPSLRYEVWKFLLDYYPWKSTNTERQKLRKQKTDEYFCMKLQWKTISAAQEERFSDYRERKSLIEKDAKRTDRTIFYFAGDNNPNVTLLSDILMTYVMYNFDLGYVQGMSDLLSPILCVMTNEADAFWCFVGFMDRVFRNFDLDQSGMKMQLNELQTLLSVVDPELTSYIRLRDSGNMFFCFRWLLVLFKREFSQSDIVKLWEVLWTDLPCKNFHLLICAAILDAEKNAIIEGNYGFTEILKHVNDLSMKIDLDTTLCTAENIFNKLNAASQLPDSVKKIIGIEESKTESVSTDSFGSPNSTGENNLESDSADNQELSVGPVTLLAREGEMVPKCYIKKFEALYKELLAEIDNTPQLSLLVLFHEKYFLSESLPSEITKKYRTTKKKFNPTYLRRMKVLEGTLFLVHPVMCHILNISAQLIPNLILNLGTYRSVIPIEYNNLKQRFLNDIRSIETLLTKRWYTKLVKILCKKNVLDNVRRCLWPRVINCATNYIRVQITELKRRTLKNILDVVADESKVPFIYLCLEYQKEIAVHPAPEDFYSLYCSLVDNVNMMVSNLSSLETWVQVPVLQETIQCQLDDGVISKSKDLFQEITKSMYHPVMQYIESIKNDYSELCDVNLRQNLELSFRNITFEENLRMIDHFQQHGEKIHKMINNIYFPVGRMNQRITVDKLQSLMNDCLLILEYNLVNIQKIEVQQILKVYENVTSKSCTVPKCTEELIEICEYIEWAQTELTMHLKNKIIDVFHKFILIVDVTEISESHMYLNSNTILGLPSLTSLLKFQSLQIQKYRNEFEVVVGARTELLNKSLDDLTPRLVVFELMDDINNIENYLPETRKFLRKLEHFDSEVAWINKEETLFKFPLSAYPELDELKNYIHPFAELLYLIYKWKLLYSVWMDSPCDRLSIEEVEHKTSVFYRNTELKLNAYSSKLKQGDESNPKRFQGNIDEAEFATLPAPIKLSSRALQQIEEFQNSLKYVKILCNPHLKISHWQEMSKTTGLDMLPYMKLPLNEIKNLNLLRQINQLEVINQGARKEMLHATIQEDTLTKWPDVVYDMEFV